MYGMDWTGDEMVLALAMRLADPDHTIAIILVLWNIIWPN